MVASGHKHTPHFAFWGPPHSRTCRPDSVSRGDHRSQCLLCYCGWHLQFARAARSVILIHTRRTSSRARRICLSFACETFSPSADANRDRWYWDVKFLVSPLIAFLRCLSGIFMGDDYQDQKQLASQHLIFIAVNTAEEEEKSLKKAAA